MAQGCLLLILHCHLPYVRHPEHAEFLEEDWLYEAVAESYVPLLHVLERLAEEGVPFRLTLSLSPSLCEMLANELLQERCARYLDRHVELAEREVRARARTPYAEAARMYLEHYRAVRRTFCERLGRRLLPAFAELARRGEVTLIGSAATHALLPLLAAPEARRAQVEVGLRNFQKHFGARPRGFWLPECAYGAGLDGLLAEFGIEFFFVDTHAVLLARPRPPLGVFAPLATPPGPLAFGRDVEASNQVWSATEGYPGDADYREFHRDLGFEADLDYLRPYLGPDGERRHLGFRYHRVSGDVPLAAKEPYRPRAAAERAAEHARHFVEARAREARRVREVTGVEPVIVAPYDGELFGHWWWEGPRFLEEIFRLVAERGDLAFVSAPEYLHRRPEEARQEGVPVPSSWGYEGYFDVWLNPTNDWLYPRLHRAEDALIEVAAALPDARGPLRRALNQCARCLMLAQASDWPFLIHSDTAREYATGRFQDLMSRFDRLLAQVRAGEVEQELLARCEWLDDPFPEMDYRAFLPAR
ncbi:MAG: glycoside hydrolase family 57 protein [Planctomycetota bacterium]|jgi:1,4-alpha-glucan branching enzyme